MTQKTEFSKTLRFLIGAASLGIALFFLQDFAGFFNMVIVAIILVILFSPLMSWLIHKKVPSFLALLITMILVIAIIIALILFLLYSFSQLSNAIPEYAKEMEELIVAVQTFVDNSGLDVEDTEAVVELVDPFQLITLVKDFLAAIVGLLSDTVFVILILAFLLIGATGFGDKAKLIIQQGNVTLERWAAYSWDIRRYTIITNNVGMMVGVFNAIMLAFIGVDFAILWGVLSWLLSFVPMVGFFLAMIPPVILALLEFGWPTALFVLVAYIVINSAVDDVLKPKLMGDGLDLAPVMVLLSVLFWGLILGPLGGILAVPMTLGIKQLVLEPDPANRWIAELISDKPRVEISEENSDVGDS